jgi:hypothetical protein
VTELRTVPLDSAAWGWRIGDVRDAEFAGHRCIEFGESVDVIAPLAGVELTDGVIELDLAVSGERAFHGLVWRVRGEEDYESFYVRPHQVRNDDSIQYNPVFNGVASWQLYHGAGFWAPVAFPIGRFFTIRVVFAGSRAEVFVADLERPALEVAELKMPVAAGRVGLLIGGPGLYVSRFAYAEGAPSFVGMDPQPRPPDPPIAGLVPAWLVSDAFPESDPAPAQLAADAFHARTWTRLEGEPTGLVNLAQVNGLRDDRNTVWARATIYADRDRVARMSFGFSDRAVVYLNGRALFGGDESYRSRDYRFLGSIGWYDSVYLPLKQGENDLAIAVSEDLGGWGIQARFEDFDGISFSESAGTPRSRPRPR